MLPLHRHQLVRLHERGWQRVLARPWDDEARACLTHWAKARLPCVVTRQPASLPEGVIAVGVAAPAQWSRRRIALEVPRSDVSFFDEFPRLDALASQFGGAARPRWQALCGELERAGVVARVYGSRGWQLLTTLRYVHRDSDIDVWMCVSDTAQADLALAALQRFDASDAPRVDGELQFMDGQAYAWREWQAWRERRCTKLLGKSLRGATLVEGRQAVGVHAQVLP